MEGSKQAAVSRVMSLGSSSRRIAHGQLGRDLGDGKASGLAGQRRAARDARVHLDDQDLARVGADGELDVGAAGLDADLADDGLGLIAQALVFAVGEGLDRAPR